MKAVTGSLFLVLISRTMMQEANSKQLLTRAGSTKYKDLTTKFKFITA